MSRTLRTTQRASRLYRCEWPYHDAEGVCERPIEPGELYVRATLPPFADPNSGPGWWTIRYHAPKAAPP